MFINKSLIMCTVACITTFSLIFPTVAMEERVAANGEAFHRFMNVYNSAQNDEDIRGSRVLLEEAADLGHNHAIVILQKVEEKEMIQRIGDLGIGMLLGGVSILAFLCCYIY